MSTVSLYASVGAQLAHYDVDVEEGSLAHDFGGRRWAVTVHSPGEVRGQVAAKKSNWPSRNRTSQGIRASPTLKV